MVRGERLPGELHGIERHVGRLTGQQDANLVDLAAELQAVVEVVGDQFGREFAQVARRSLRQTGKLAERPVRDIGRDAVLAHDLQTLVILHRLEVKLLGRDDLAGGLVLALLRACEQFVEVEEALVRRTGSPLVGSLHQGRHGVSPVE